MTMNACLFTMKDDVAPQRAIIVFRGEFAFLSNFTACVVTLPAADGLPALEYPSTEHAYVASKTCDLAVRAALCAMSAGEAKKAAQQTDFPHGPPRTDQERIALMLDLSRQKYSLNNPSLRAQLLATGDAVLIEGNTWGDAFWGFDLIAAHGDNNLGRILMQVRREITEK